MASRLSRARRLSPDLDTVFGGQSPGWTPVAPASESPASAVFWSMAELSSFGRGAGRALCPVASDRGRRMGRTRPRLSCRRSPLHSPQIKLPSPDMLRPLTTASNEMEAEVIVGRLAEAGIHCMQSGGVLRPSVGGGCSVYVEEADRDRAREVLKADEGGFDEEELARLSDEAGREALGSNSSSTQPTPAQQYGQGGRASRALGTGEARSFGDAREPRQGQARDGYAG